MHGEGEWYEWVKQAKEEEKWTMGCQKSLANGWGNLSTY